MAAGNGFRTGAKMAGEVGNSTNLKYREMSPLVTTAAGSNTLLDSEANDQPSP